MSALISVVCPTRGRPEAFAAMVASALETASEPDAIEVCACVDGDDPKRSEYQTECRYNMVPPGTLMSDLWNYGAARGEILMLAADDLRFRATGWDAMVREEFERWPDRLVVVWGPDGNTNGQRATHPFVHQRWIDLFGRFTPPYFVADYPDLWLYEVAHAAERDVFVPELFIEHMHVSLGKSPMDETEARKVERQHGEVRPVQVWEARAPERAAEVERLLAAIA